MGKIRVFIVDDSMVFRNYISQTLASSQEFEIIGTATNGYEALKTIPEMKPDVVTMDIEMPRLNGIELLKQLLPVYPVPVVLVSSLSITVFDALSAGAVDFVKKPDWTNMQNRDAFDENLRQKLKMAAGSKVHLPKDPGKAARTTDERNYDHASQVANATRILKTDKIIAIGASTGGTEAILSVVRNFPADMPGVVITQHMPAGFTAMYSERLNRICKMEVKEAKNGDKVVQGRMLIAPGGYQMRVVRIGNGYEVTVTQEERVNGHAPSVDVLFNSVAQNVRDHAIGVILTGMGADGAAGLLRMRKAGAFTIGQDKESCVVYGMPMTSWGLCASRRACSISRGSSTSSWEFTRNIKRMKQ